MRRFRIPYLLIALNGGLVLLVVAGVAGGAVRVLRQLASRQALARVELAANGAAAVIERAGDRVAAAARLAADRPDLVKLLPAGERETPAAGDQAARPSGGLEVVPARDREAAPARDREAVPASDRAALPAADRAALAAWLERIRRGGDLTGCAVFAGGRLLASAGPPLDWGVLRQPAGGRGLVVGPGGSLILGGTAAASTVPGVEAVAALALDDAFVRRLGSQIGLEIEVLDARGAIAASEPAAGVRERALDRLDGAEIGGAAPAAGDPGGSLAAGGSHPPAAPDGAPAAGGAEVAAAPGGSRGAAERVEAIDLYVADVPLAGPAGKAVGLVEARLPAATVDGPLAELSGRLMLLALVVAVLATAASAAAGRWLAGPVRQLTASAARLGRGDLTTPIDRAPGVELGTLAATLEETRRQLLRLTAELRRRQAEGEAVVTGIAEGVFSVDRDRRIRYLNPQAAALLGVTGDQVLGRFCGDVLNPRRGDGAGRPCEDGCPIVHARFRGGARATEHLQLAGGGRRSVVITSAGPVEGRQFLVMRDETEVELARRQRDAVLANISHEFKTPLAAQRASLELLREKLTPEGAEGEADETRSLVLTLERGGLRLTQLIDNLLESVRIESGQDSVRQRAVALDEVIEEAVELTAPLFALRRQRVEVELPYPLPAVVGDAPRLTQVFVNLLANANKFAPDGSPLRVGGEVGAHQVTLWVEDQGPGLPPTAESGRELFRRFVRSPEEMGEPDQGGMGLGLWIVQSIVERHGGAVVAERRSPGTRMRVTLPRAPEGAAAAAPRGTAHAGAAGNRDAGPAAGRGAVAPGTPGEPRPSAAEAGGAVGGTAGEMAQAEGGRP
jgi:signal transduction histidine kinase